MMDIIYASNTLWNRQNPWYDVKSNFVSLDKQRPKTSDLYTLLFCYHYYAIRIGVLSVSKVSSI